MVSTINFVFWSVLLAAGQEPPATVRQDRPPSKRVVAVIAIDDYRIKYPWVHIPNAEQNAHDLVKTLRDDFSFELLQSQSESGLPLGELLGPKAILTNIQDQLKKLVENTREADQVIFCFVGHGTDEGLLVPYDATANDGFITIQYLLEQLDKIKAKQVLVLLDACHSGFAIPTLTFNLAEPNPMKKVRFVMAAALPSGKAYAQKDSENGSNGAHGPFFTSSIVDILQNNSCDVSGAGFCTAFELAMLARRMVLEKAAAYGEVQIPIFGNFGSEEGDFTLERRGAETAAWKNLKGQYPFTRSSVIPDEATIKEYSMLLESFAGNLKGIYFEQAQRLQRQFRLKVLRDTNVILPVPDFVGLDLESSLGGRVATHQLSTHSHDDVNLDYVWVPRSRTGLGGFWIGATEVPVKAFRAKFPMAHPMDPLFYRSSEHANLPRVNVSIQEAQDFCTGEGGRLPTISEWEFAADGAQGHDSHPEASTLNMDGRIGYIPPVGRPVPVDALATADSNRRFAQNSLSMYHVLGNVAEWVTQGAGKPAMPDSFADIRGGSFADRYDRKDPLTKRRVDPRGGNTVGFRCVMDPAPKVPLINQGAQ